MIKEPQPPANPVDPHAIQARRVDALYKAKDNDIGILRPEEGRWLGEQARIAVETGNRVVPDITAHRAAEVPQPEQPRAEAGSEQPQQPA